VGKIAVRAFKGVSIVIEPASFVSFVMRELERESGFQEEFLVFANQQTPKGLKYAAEISQ